MAAEIVDLPPTSFIPCLSRTQAHSKVQEVTDPLLDQFMARTVSSSVRLRSTLWTKSFSFASPSSARQEERRKAFKKIPDFPSAVGRSSRSLRTISSPGIVDFGALVFVHRHLNTSVWLELTTTTSSTGPLPYHTT